MRAAGHRSALCDEGKFIAVVPPDEAPEALAALRAHPLGRDAVQIGEMRKEPPGIVVFVTPIGGTRIVVFVTPIGGTRIVDMLVGDPLPRIC